MCFRPPTIEGATIACPKCGAQMPMDAPKCPSCGAPNAAAPAAPPAIPTTPGAPVPVIQPPSAPSAATVPKSVAAVRTASSAQPATDNEPLRIPQVGGHIRTPKGASPEFASSAPEVPTGPGFEEAPDISNTGNYFVSSQYNNG